MKRSYLIFFILGIVFIGLAASGRSNVYYGIAAVFLVIGFIVRRRTGNQ